MAKSEPEHNVKVKCGRSRQWLNSQTPEYREMILRYLAMQEYKHLCPCPYAGGNWGYRSDCAKCRFAIREEV